MWNCIPSADHTTIYSESTMKFTYGFPSNIPIEKYNVEINLINYYIRISNFRPLNQLIQLIVFHA